MKKDLIIVAAPSGAGKSSFVEKICVGESRLFDTVTYTTRAMRLGESEGKPYHFVSRTEFEQKVREGFFIEWAKVHDNFYGTSQAQLEAAWSRGQSVIMDVDVQGAKTFKEKFPDRFVGIFILPPSLEELRRRVIKRDGGVPADLELRMLNAAREIEQAPHFDHQIVNDDFARSFAGFKKIIDQLLSSH